ncbi:universal stress protein [Indiicoccus explosivorum]|uniref:universal stress protein n=1 Tax=Indiicoccus explosivorum TaxID=1917864 RepID=UPI000B4304AC|nr:universal stress protein [Indiicoccus explosivorum]
MTIHYKQIIVAVDGSKEAEWALEKSIGIAKRNDAQLNIVTVIDPRVDAIEVYDRQYADLSHKRCEELLGKYRQRAEAAGVQKVNTLVSVGSPKKAISRDIAKKIHADLIVCGATGHSNMERFLIGSVSESIVRTSACDVLVVRTEEAAEVNT